MTPSEIQNALPYFTGTSSYYRIYPNVLLTDGAFFLCKEANCFWLPKLVFSLQGMDDNVRKEEFQVYRICNNIDTNTCRVECSDGNHNILFQMIFDNYQFILPEVKLFYTDKILLLPSEY